MRAVLCAHVPDLLLLGRDDLREAVLERGGGRGGKATGDAEHGGETENFCCH